MTQANKHLRYGTPSALDVLAIAPHPDDAEIGCGGTLAKAQVAGKRTGILELTRGESGSLGTPEIRDAESMQAAKILGLSYRGNLCLEDGNISDDASSRNALAQVLRDVQPKILLVPHSHDRHPDHRAAAQLSASAVHLAGLRKAKLVGQAHKVSRIFYYQGNAAIQANVLVDIGEHMDTWAAAIMAHASQFSGEAISETVTPEILERRKARLMYWATFVGVRYAEAFESALPVTMNLWE